jgi:two-component system NtrC family sensor kinase
MIGGADQLSRSIASATWHSMLADHRESAYEVMQTIALQQGIDRIRIYNKEGRVMFSTASNDVRQVDKRAEECYLCHASDRPLVKVDVPTRSRVFWGSDGQRKLAMVTPIYNEPSCSQSDCHAHPSSINVLGVLDVSLDLSGVDAEISDVRKSVISSILIHVVLVGLLIVFLTRRFVDAPIDELVAATQAVSEMKLDEPLRVRATGELGMLARSFDVMRERLRKAMEDINEFTQSLETKVRDRTEELRAVHQRLAQTDRLTSLGQLAASVAHEINNPLSGVLNLSMLMQRIITQEGIPPGRVEEVRRYLNQISNETGRVGRIVSDLLAFSRRSSPHRVDADLSSIVRSVMSIIGHKFKLLNVDLDYQVAPDVPRFHCDPSQIQQVLLNLLMNAAEATQSRGGGTVELRARKEGDRVVIRVKDDGDGIAPEYVSKIFDPFFTTKGEGKGVGLGLAVVYGIIEAHQGDIDVKSALGVGTTFTVSLPLTAPLAPGPEATA